MSKNFLHFDHHVYKIRNSEMNGYYERQDGFVTTIAQLNAFRFFISSGVVDYAIQHLEEVEHDMVNYHLPDIKKKKQVDSVANFQTYVTYNVQMTIKFK